MKEPEDVTGMGREASRDFQLDDVRRERQWRQIQARLAPAQASRRTTPRWWWAAGAGVACAGLALVVVRPFMAIDAQDRSAPALASLETPRASAPVGGTPARPAAPEGGGSVVLSDGSVVKTHVRSRVRVVKDEPDEIALRVTEGTAAFDVTHAPERGAFLVEAADVEVRVVGTRFSVALEPGPGQSRRVRVVVDEGRVAIRRLGQAGPATTFVSAGGTWSGETERQELASRRFAEAERLFAAGHVEAAARRYDELRREHRDDPRAPLASLALARLYQDHFAQPRKALAALDDALALDPPRALTEHASARRIWALHALALTQACREAREAFTARYPQSPHVSKLRGLCR